MRNKIKVNLFAISVLLLGSCGENTPPETKQNQKILIDTSIYSKKEPIPIAPDFNADTAYFFIEKQVAFGPRVPNSNAHSKCANYLASELKRFNWEVQIQEGKVTTFNKKVLDMKNIIGSYNPTHAKRILLFAHWDTRPFADKDTKDQNKPIL